MEALKDCSTNNEIRKALKSLPETLDETYDRILSKIKPKHRQYAIAAINWIAFSFRPLRLKELTEAVNIDLNSDQPMDADDRISPDAIVQILSGLIVLVYPEKKRYWQPIDIEPRVRFAHFSVQEYLISDRMNPVNVVFRTSENTAHNLIGESCLTYIMTCNLKDVGYVSGMISGLKC